MPSPHLKLLIFSILITSPALGANGEDDDLDFLPPVGNDTKTLLNKEKSKEIF